MADLKGYVTAAGQNFEALAKQMGYPVQIGTIEIGDGVLPDSESPIARTNLVHYLKSFPAILEVDPVNPGQFIVSCNIPADDAINGAGYFIREMGCRLAGQGAGVLYAYRRISNDFKPLITQGEAKSFIYKLRFIPSNGELLTPVIDPSIVFASVQYCDNKIASELAKRDHKQSVRVATTAAIALTATQTIDGVALAVGDRVLVKDQADAKQNGIYIVAAQAWTRTTDADHGTELNAGARVYVEEGTVNGTRVWYLATTGVITIGTTLLQFKEEHPAASETVLGMMKVATQAQTDAGTVDDVAVTPKKLKAWVKKATETMLGMMKVATQAQTDAGAEDDIAVTPKKLKFGCSAKLSPNGYIVFPSWLGGLILQWGGSSATNSAPVSVSFPIAFPNRVHAVFTSDARSSSYPMVKTTWQVGDLVTTGFVAINMGTITQNSAGSSPAFGAPTISGCPWFAIGY